MKTAFARRITLTVGVIVSVIFLTTPVLAAKKPPPVTLGSLECTQDEIAKFDGANWVCSIDEGIGSGWVLMDSDVPPKPVGEVVSVLGINDALVALQVADRETLIEATTDVYNTIKGFPTFYYESTDCSGQAYVGGTYDPTVASKVNWLDQVYIKNGELGDRYARTPYEIIGGPDRTRTDYMSRLTYSTCFQEEGSYSMFPVVQIADDLSITYPPPYTLIRE